MAINKSVRDTTVLAAVVFAAVVTLMANLLADRKFVRVDLTKEGRYSLSKPFLNIMGELKDPLKITYYVLRECPPFETYKREMLDKLNEIKTASHGKIVLEVADPTENPQLYERLKREGFEKEIGESKKDQISVSRVFSGFEITYQAKPKAKLEFVYEPETLEYALGSRIIEFTIKDKPIVAVQAPVPQQQMQMPGQPSAQLSGFEWLQQGYWDDAKKFDVRSIDLSEHNGIPEKTALLILIRPRELSERQRFEVEKYLAGGGKVLLVASPFRVGHEMFTWQAERTPTGLEDYLESAGLTFNSEFVCDNMNLRAPTGVNPVTRKIEYSKNPFFVSIQAQNIDQESVLTRLMPGLLMPSPSEIKLNAETLKKQNLTCTVLAKTSKQSWTVPFSETINPDAEARYDESTKAYSGSKNVFVTLEGQFPFPYQNKPAPAWGDAAKKGDAPQKDAGAPVVIEQRPGLLIVCSCPEAFHQMYLENEQIGRLMQTNQALIINVAEKVSLGDDLIRLRTKHYEARTINRMAGAENDKKRNAIKLGLIIGAPCLVIIFGLLWVGLRRAAQTRYERKFAQTSGPSSFTP